ncbi:MAG: UDP-N-acetylmuramate dehydrogenase [Rothia sp. (in: high G+C Gram-positive bacteria)]|nr:UDP-N-acetylmuramate dehydrogenase [Rothia sp. (in: high G+C Gram-positive bacteria)]
MTDKLLSELTTAAVGGPARLFIEAKSEQEIIDAVTAADKAGDTLLVVGGGSNLLVADDGFDGVVVHVASTGIETLSDSACSGTTLRVQAGHSWDDFVAYTVEHELSGVEALSGIPGTVGATPVQNVGAYGSEVAHTIASVRTWDRETGGYKTFTNADLKFAYRDSVLKQTTVNGSPRYVVLTVDFQLPHGPLSAPVRYAELARQLGVEAGERADSHQVRETVLRLRGGKGMVLDATDRDTYSTGSFFTNPIVGQDVAAQLPEDAPRYPATTPTGEPLEGMVKLSAAWLIQQAGFDKGFGLAGEALDLAGGRASLSTKHTLAITNRGGASTSDIAAIARAVRSGVEQSFGVRLVPEPVVVGFTL